MCCINNICLIFSSFCILFYWSALFFYHSCIRKYQSWNILFLYFIFHLTLFVDVKQYAEWFFLYYHKFAFIICVFWEMKPNIIGLILTKGLEKTWKSLKVREHITFWQTPGACRSDVWCVLTTLHAPNIKNSPKPGHPFVIHAWNLEGGCWFCMGKKIGLVILLNNRNVWMRTSGFLSRQPRKWQIGFLLLGPWRGPHLFFSLFLTFWGKCET